ncbi:MAG: hypothetical protein AAFQ22_07105 [Pseudomonadota bacterium]
MIITTTAWTVFLLFFAGVCYWGTRRSGFWWGLAAFVVGAVFLVSGVTAFHDMARAWSGYPVDSLNVSVFTLAGLCVALVKFTDWMGIERGDRI